MTRRTLMLVMVLALTLVCGKAMAAGASKIAYVDLQRALLEVNDGKQAKANIKKYFDEKQAMLDVEQEKLKTMKEEMDKQAMALSDDVRKQKEAEFQKKLMELQKLFMNLQTELKKREEEATRPIFERMRNILQNIGEKENFDLILETNSTGIVYAPAKFDLTNELIRKYDAKYGKGKKK